MPRYPVEVPATAPAALTGLLDILRCPSCGASLQESERALRCANRHTFDLARAGYVSLLAGSGAISGDDDEMARARARFLATGAYSPLLEAIGDLSAATFPQLAAQSPVAAGGAPRTSAPTILDAGCGPGYYLAGLLDRFPAARGLGFDTSARSLRFAARAHARAAVYSGDVFAPFPLVDSSVDLLLDVFAPRQPEEFARVLRPSGRLVVVRPAGEHLAELRDLIPAMVSVDPHKEERLHTALDPFFDVLEQRVVRYQLPLDPQRIRDLVAMTPSARHVEVADLDHLLARAPQDDSGSSQLAAGSAPVPFHVTVSVLISAHRPR